MKKLFAQAGTGLAILAAPAIASAQAFNVNDLGRLFELLTPVRPAPNAQLDLLGLAVLILNFLILIAAILAIFYLIWAGIRYITAGVDDEQAKKARSAIYNAVIGIVVIILSYVIIQYVAILARNTAESNFGAGGGTGGLPFNNTAF